jgi:ppGpp synthetase/RelA/SpoT-type nucleotidyltranferase
VVLLPIGANQPQAPFPFSFTAFEEWYEKQTMREYEPARAALCRIISQALDEQLSDRDRLRIRVSHSRIKNPERLWAKMLRNKYAGKITTLDAIALTVDDIVGVRITCNNTSDVTVVKEILADLPSAGEEAEVDGNGGLLIEADSEKHYDTVPKESGYRAYHINLRVTVPAFGKSTLVRAEVQVRTLLQDGWGELTHEDTYKPGAELPSLAKRLARRMADLLAAVDDLAQDLREELDALSAHELGEPLEDAQLTAVSLELASAVATGEASPEAIVEEQPATEDLRQALISRTRRVVSGLTKPATLAEVAHRVRADFGREVTNSWGGFGSFKALVKGAVPDATVVDGAPGILYPPGVSVDVEHVQSSEVEMAGTPQIVLRLRAFDHAVPVGNRERISVVLDALMATLHEDVWVELGIERSVPGIRDINALSKFGRDQATQNGINVSRTPLDYFLKALLFTGNLQPSPDRRHVVIVIARSILARAMARGLFTDVPAQNREVFEWLGASGD